MKEFMTKKIKLDVSVLLYATMIYLYLPILLFFVGWTKWYIAVICIATMSFGLYKMFSDLCPKGDVKKTNKAKKNARKDVYLYTWMFAVVVLGAVLICIFSGIGGVFAESGDWPKHNAVLNDLVCKKWPVYYYHEDGTSLLSYYIAGYMVPALVGKVFGKSFEVANVAMFIWCMIAIVICILWLIELFYAEKTVKQLLMIFLFFMFGNMTYLGGAIYTYFKLGYVDNNIYYLCFEPYLQYRSNITCIRWVPTQALAIWLSMSVFWKYRDKRQHYLAFFLPTMLFSAVAFVGVAVLAIGQAAARLFFHDKNEESVIKTSFSLQNVLLIMTSAVVFLIYYAGNAFSEKPESIAIHFASYKGNVFLYVVFIFSTFLFYSLLVFKKNKHDTLFYVTNIFLLLLPFVGMGPGNDMVMSGGIAGMYLIFMYVVDFLYDDIKRNKVHTVLLVCALSVGVFTSALEIKEMFDMTYKDEIKKFMYENNSLDKYVTRKHPTTVDLTYNYVAYDVEEDFFQNHIARKKANK